MNQDLAGYSLFNALHIDGLLLNQALWVDGNNTRATAEGSVGDPFATIQAAIDAHVAAGITDVTPRVTIVYGGVYDEALTLPSKGTFDIICMGAVEVGTSVSSRNISRTCDSADQLPGEEPMLRIIGIGRGVPDSGTFTLWGKFVLADATAGQLQNVELHNVIAFGVALANAVDGTGQTLALNLDCSGCFVYGINAVTALLRTRDSTYEAAVSVNIAARADGCEFDDVTVVVAAGALPILQLLGFYNCAITGDFTGPASSFLADAVTWSIFNAGSGSLLGGATFALVEDTVPHAGNHSDGGTDEITAQNLGSGAATIGQRLVADGAGALAASSNIDCGTF